MIDLTRLVPYRRSLRPPLPESLPLYLDGELQRLSVITNNLVQALQEADARIAALEAP